MTNKIPNLEVSEGQGGRRLNKDAQERRDSAGRKNLAGWHARARETVEATAAELESFHSKIMAELGPNPTATKLALAHAAVSNFNSIVLLNKELRKQRKRNVLALAERVSWLSSNLARLLQRLGLDNRPLPRTLGDVLAGKVLQNQTIDAPNPPETA